MKHTVIFFSHPAPTKSSLSSSASDEQTLEMAEKTIRPTAFKQEKIKEYKYYNNTLLGLEAMLTVPVRFGTGFVLLLVSHITV